MQPCWEMHWQNTRKGFPHLNVTASSLKLHLFNHRFIIWNCFSWNVCLSFFQINETWYSGFKGIVHPKIKKKQMLKMSSPSGQSRYKGVCFFVRSDLEKGGIPSLGMNQWIIWSEWVPSARQSKQPMKHHNNPH